MMLAEERCKAVVEELCAELAPKVVPWFHDFSGSCGSMVQWFHVFEKSYHHQKVNQ
jgi:hypothetical protein